MNSILKDSKVKKRIMGSEGIIYIYDDKIYKKFLSSISKETRNNKKNKLLFLDKYAELKEYYNEIYSLVYSHSHSYISGYIVEKIDGKSLDLLDTDLENKIKILKELKKIIFKLEEYNIEYVDINLSNIFYINDSKIKLVDIDNIKTNEFELDMLPITYKNYFSFGGYDFGNAKKFVFNLMSLLFLLGISRTNDIKNLNIYQKQLDFLNDDAKNLCNDLLNIKIGSSCDNEYLIDKIDEKILKK